MTTNLANVLAVSTVAAHGNVWRVEKKRLFKKAQPGKFYWVFGILGKTWGF